MYGLFSLKATELNQVCKILVFFFLKLLFKEASINSKVLFGMVVLKAFERSQEKFTATS